jgi:predicted transcriptional regulator
MKTKTLPPLRVTPELRRDAESVLVEGETLSAFVLESVARNIEARRAQQAFIERGLASAARARKSGKYVSAEAVLRKLSRRLESARARRAAHSKTTG